MKIKPIPITSIDDRQIDAYEQMDGLHDWMDRSMVRQIERSMQMNLYEPRCEKTGLRGF